MIPIIRDHPEDRTKAQLFWNGKERDLSLAECVKFYDILHGVVMRAACEKAADERAKSATVHIEGWGIFGCANGQ